jgi:anaerobic selenocysteine-containing dehydrogenase
MKPTRREFLWTMGAASASFALWRMQDVVWGEQDSVDPGWKPGIQEFLASTCLICPSRCGIRGRVMDGDLVSIAGNPLHPMSRGGLCPRGVAGVQMLYHPDRLTKPLIREGARGEGQWREATREEALEQIVERLRSLRTAGRPEALALAAGYSAGTMQDVWRQFLTAFGSPNYIADDYDDRTDAVIELMHGIPRRPGYDLERADLVLSFGAPLFESWWSPLQAFVAFANPDREDEQRPRFIQVDTRFSRTAARAQEWVGIRPGTHAVLALGIAYVLIRDELYDAEFVANHVSGFEDYVDAEGRRREGYRSLVMRNYRTEEVSVSTGVPVERITSLARTLAQSDRPITVLGSDVTQAPNGLLAGLAVHSLNALTGSLNRPGGAIGVTRPPFGTATEALHFAEGVAGTAGAPIEALLLYYANPLASSVRPEMWQAALEKIPFVVSFSPFLDQTARFADVILPDVLPYERWQDAPAPSSYPYAVWGLTRPLTAPPPDAMHTGDAVLGIANALGGSVARSLPYEDFESLLRARARGLFGAGRGMSFGDDFERRHHRQMEERGWWLPEHAEFEPFWEELVERGGWTDLFYDDTDPGRLARTVSGRIELLPSQLFHVLEAEGGRRAPYIDVAGPPDGGSEEFPLRLLPYRLSTLASGTLALERWLAEVPGLFPHVLWRPWVEVHPETAKTLGLDEGAAVWVISPERRYRAQVKIFPGTAPENVCAPYGLPHPDGELASPLQLLGDSVDRLTGLRSWATTFVRLERA